MAKTRGVEVGKADGKWSWHCQGRLWEFILDPYKRRSLLRDGMTIMGPIAVSQVPLCCPDDAILFSMGYEYAVNDIKGKGDAA